MTNPRIQAIEQEILALAQPEAEQYSGIAGGWAKAVVKSWNENTSSGRLATLRDILDTGYQGNGEGYYFNTSELQTQVIKLFNEWNDILKKELEQKIAELETNLQTEREVHQAALETSRVWHERQKAELKEQHGRELAEAQELTSKLQQDNRDLLNDIHQYKQKITTHEQKITDLETNEQDLISQLHQAQQKQQNHLSQEKSFLHREIQLIKEVLHD
jgi:hypothetical protein